MSAIESSATANAPDTSADKASLLNLSVHSLPAAGAETVVATRTARGRLQMLLVLLVCAVPVVASYLAYFVWRPIARTNYGELMAPTRPLPASLPLRGLDGQPVAPASLQGQWLLIVVAGGACDARCERMLWLQRQLVETLGREKMRVDKVWLVDDGAVPAARTLQAIGADTRNPVQGLASPAVLRVERAALERWLEPASGQALEDHVYIVDPQGEWMMRTPPRPDPARLKRDVDKLLRASAGWDQPGR